MVNDILDTRGESYWTVSGVQHRGKVLTVEIQNGFLDNMTHAEAVDFARNAKLNEFRPASMPFNYSVIKAAYNLPDGKPKETLQKFFQKSMRSNFVLTLTDIDYMPIGKDVVTHFDILTKKPLLQKVRVVGQDRFIEEDDSACLEVLVGTGNISEINRVSDWANGTNAYVSGVNIKPDNVKERVVGFGADSDGLYFLCSCNPGYSGPSFGVRPVREAATQKTE